MVLPDLLPGPEEKLCHTLWPGREAGGGPSKFIAPRVAQLGISTACLALGRPLNQMTDCSHKSREEHSAVAVMAVSRKRP